MRYKQLKLSAVLILFGFGLTNLQAQESVNATGGNATGSGGSLSWSVGQVFYETHIGMSGSMAEGVQHPYEIFEVTGIEEAKGMNLSASAYPNPTNNHLTLRIDQFDISNLSYHLYDLNGRLLDNKKITDKLTRIPMSTLASATYFIKVIQNNLEVKTFKIIKN